MRDEFPGKSPDQAPPAPRASPDASSIAQGLAAFIDPGQVVELRVLKAILPGSKKPTNVSRYFEATGDGLLRLAEEALKYNGHAPAVYLTLNQVDRALLGGRRAAKDSDVLRRRLLLVDIDPARAPSAMEVARREQGQDFTGLSATDDEKMGAWRKAVRIREHLTRLGFPDCVVGDSGNGFHLLYMIDLPNDDASRELLKGFLASLASTFASPEAEVDRSVFNASRIVKLYGTEARKGIATPERPHRPSGILSIPRAFTAVPVELLEAVAFGPATPTVGTPIDQPSGPSPEAPARPLPRHQDYEPKSDRWTPEARCVAYLDRCDGAVSGENGHAQAFRVAASAGPGFNLSEETFLHILASVWNPKCVPPWSESELRHKVSEAYKVESRRGWLLDVPRASEIRGGGSSNGNGRAHTANGRDDHPPVDGGGGDDGEGEPPETIIITTEEYKVIDQAVIALAKDPNVYQRANMLMTIHRDDTPKNRIIIRPPGSPRISLLPQPRIRELLTRWASWKKVRKDEQVPAHPPDWVVPAVSARGSWPEIRSVEAVTEAPVLRPDGTILDRPGYDEATGLLYEPNAPFMAIPTNPTRDDARKAAGTLLELVCDFPFAGDHHRASWLASLLTPLARFGIAGPCPMFLIEANTPGTGKSKLTDVVSIVASGRCMPRTTYPDTEDEMRKRISSIALAGDRLMLIDNIATTFGGSALDSALTAMTWRDRVLGRSEMTPELPLFTVWYGTGNNVALRGDVLRRIVPSRLETKEERPEERRDFKIPGDFIEHVKRERPRFVAAALTLLRAHAVAGRPDGGLTPLGSFEAWSLVVRSAVYWAIEIDPCKTREELRAADPDVLARTALVEGWLGLPEGRFGVTVATALKLVKDEPARFEKLHGAFMEWSRKDELPSARSIGMKLKGLKGRVINGKVLYSKEDHGTQLWRVEFVPGQG